MVLILSEKFAKAYDKIVDESLREKIFKHLERIEDHPEIGKPLRHQWKNHRSVRIPPFRIIYRLEGTDILVVCFDHRKDVYD